MASRKMEDAIQEGKVNKEEFIVSDFEVLLEKKNPRYMYKLKEDIKYSATVVMLNFPEKYDAPLLTPENFRKVVKENFKWAKSIRIPWCASDEVESLTSVVPAFVMTTAPNFIPGGPQLQAYMCWNWLFTFIDDFLDDAMLKKSDDREETREEQLEKLRKMRNEKVYLCEIFRGNFEVDIEPLRPLVVPELEAVGRMIRVLVETLCACVPNYLQRNKHFDIAFDGWFGAPLWIYARENYIEASERSHIYYRSMTFGTHMLFELLSLLNGIDVPEFVREELDFIRYRDAIGVVLGVMNDVFSAGRELADNEKENLVILKMINKKMSLQEAVDESVLFINQETEEARVYASRLLEQFPGNEALYTLFKAMSFLVDGHHSFFAKVLRYGTITHKYRTVSKEEYLDILRHPAIRTGAK